MAEYLREQEEAALAAAEAVARAEEEEKEAAAISESIHLLLFISAALAKSMHARLSLLRDEGPNGYDGTQADSLRPLCPLKSGVKIERS